MNLNEQTNRIKQMMNIVENYDEERLYPREDMVKKLSTKGTPKYIKDYVKNLEHINHIDSEGNKKVYTKIPQFIYMYLVGRA